MNQRLPFVALWALAAVSCVTADTTMIGKARPARAYNCDVTVHPDVPAFPVENIATSQAQCNSPRSRNSCIEALKEEACKVGANLVYGFREGKTKEAQIITATLALVAEGTSGSASATPIAESCNPPCSPGYQCEANAGKPLCNPACSPGYACANDRTCQPAAQSAPAAGAPPG